MQTSGDIKTRLRSVSNIAKITKAMQLISVVKMRKTLKKLEFSNRYLKLIVEDLSKLYSNADTSKNIYFVPNNVTGKKAYFVVASDGGLCGDYNRRIQELASKTIKNGVDIVLPLGEHIKEFFERKGIEIDTRFATYLQKYSLHQARIISLTLLTMFEDHTIDEVHVIYSKRENGKDCTIDKQLLPICNLPKMAIDKDLMIEPTTEETIKQAVYQYILANVLDCVYEAEKSEHTDRMTAMNSATNNAGEMIGEIELEYHRVRQQEITSELAEISAGFRDMKD